jgi:D-proline reductase (dithiol) PrdB
MNIALIASGGIYAHGQIAFHHKDDLSYRIIDTEIDSTQLRTSHFAYDLTPARENINVVFPIDTLKTLAHQGIIRSLSRRAYTFMGGIYSARKVRDLLAPHLLKALQEDEVDLALLVPA